MTLTLTTHTKLHNTSDVGSANKLHIYGTVSQLDNEKKKNSIGNCDAVLFSTPDQCCVRTCLSSVFACVTYEF